MLTKTMRALESYLIALQNEGHERIHISEIIPHSRLGLAWTSFPPLEFHRDSGIKYDRRSGWIKLGPMGS